MAKGRRNKGIRYPSGWPSPKRKLYPNGWPGNMQAVLYLNHRQRLEQENDGSQTPSFPSSQGNLVYDPSVLGSLFQDHAATIPVENDGDPVGLMLDLSEGSALSPELIENGTFDNGTEGWIATRNCTLSEEGGHLRVQASSNSYGGAASAEIVTIPGKTYLFNYESISRNGGYHNERIGVSTRPNFDKNADIYERYSPPLGRVSVVFKARTDKTYILLGASSPNNYVLIDNVSVREFVGNHAAQANADKRPIFRTDGELSWLEFDGVKQHLKVDELNLTGKAESIVVTGFEKGTDNAAVLLEHGTDSETVNQSFGIMAPSITGQYDITCNLNGTKLSRMYATGMPKEWPYTYTLELNLSIGLANSRVNYRPASKMFEDAGVSAHESLPLFIGCRNGASHFFNGKFYGLLISGDEYDEADLDHYEMWMSLRSGSHSKDVRQIWRDDEIWRDTSIWRG